jgi:hypothetical protein
MSKFFPKYSPDGKMDEAEDQSARAKALDPAR